jgi:hypothetical protein
MEATLMAWGNFSRPVRRRNWWSISRAVADQLVLEAFQRDAILISGVSGQEIQIIDDVDADTWYRIQFAMSGPDTMQAVAQFYEGSAEEAEAYERFDLNQADDVLARAIVRWFVQNML